MNNLTFLLESQGDYVGAELQYRRTLERLLKISTTTKRAHPGLQTVVGNYAGCLKKLGRSPVEIRSVLEAMMFPFGEILRRRGGPGGEGPSPKLRAVIEQPMRDPSRLQELAKHLRREDPELFMELVQWIQSQQ